MSLLLLALQLSLTEPSVVEETFARGRVAVRLVLDLDAQLDEQEILVSIGHHESRWSNIHGKGKACGPTQIESPETWGSTCKAISQNEREGYAVALRVLRYARSVCPGTWARVLTAYVSGKCGVAPLKARELCLPTGLCDKPYRPLALTPLTHG